MMVKAVLITGGNEGDVAGRLAKALQMIAESVGTVTAYSKIYRSQAWGFRSDEFLNQAAEVETELSPQKLLDAVQAIERELGRDRTVEADEKRRTGQRYAARPIDIDILFYGDEVIDTERLKIPHPAIAERRFVLEPLAEICPRKVHPVSGETVEEMFLRVKSKETKE